jgi:hypothetical protein
VWSHERSVLSRGLQFLPMLLSGDRASPQQLYVGRCLKILQLILIASALMGVARP